MEQLDEVRRGRRRAIVDASIATVTIGGTLCALHWLTRSDGRDEEATNKTPVYIPLKVEDYTAVSWKPDVETDGQVDCDLDYIMKNPCELNQPLSSCRDCKGFFQCQRTSESIRVHDVTTNATLDIDMPADETLGRCLPLKQANFSCNPYSGRAVLARRGDKIFWFCDPKYPALVTKRGYFDDAIDDRLACGGSGTLVNGQTGIPWRETRDFEPIHGTCRCGEGMVPTNFGKDGNALDCIRDPCAPGRVRIDGSGICTCPSGFVPCHDGSLFFDPEELQYHCPRAVLSNESRCVPDPCRPLGTSDSRTGLCVPHNTELYELLLPNANDPAPSRLPRRGHIVLRRTDANCPKITIRPI